MTDRRGEWLVAYFPAPEGGDAAARELAREVGLRVEASTSLRDVPAEWWWVPAGEPPASEMGEGGEVVRISPTLTVDRSGLPEGAARDPAETGEGLVIRLAPGLGFGDAGHPTTRAVLGELESRVSSGDAILDLGTGSGILAVAAARLGASRVDAVERDRYACRAALQNVERNGVSEVVRVRPWEVAPGDLRGGGPWDGILANVVPRILKPLLPELAEELRQGGWLILSGASGGERDPVLATAADAGLSVEEERWDEGWWSVVLRRP